MTEEETMFDTATVSEELPETMEGAPDEGERTTEAWKPHVATESPKDKKSRLGEKKEADGRVLTVKEVGFTRPKMKAPDGTPIEPKKTQDETKSYYPGKLIIKFNEDNLVEYYPSFKYYVNDNGVVNNSAKIYRDGDNAISKLFKLVIAKMAKPAEEVSDQDVYNFLVGKKVKVKTTKGKYLGKNWFRNDIVEIV